MRPPRPRKGIALLEALVALLVLSVGLLSIAKLQVRLRIGADQSRERSEAVRIAEQEIESMRTFSSAALTPGTSAYDTLASAKRDVEPASGSATSTRFSIVRTVDTATLPTAKSVTVSVEWLDRGGMPRQAVMSTWVAGIDPALSGALGLVHTAAALGPAGRAPSIPASAKDLGDGRSAFKPSSDGTTAFVFDNLSGALGSVCTGVSSQRSTRDLGPIDLAHCDTRTGTLLSGTIRTSVAAPPDLAGRDAPLRAGVALALAPAGAGASYPAQPVCEAEPMKTVSFWTNGVWHTEAVPQAATPAAMGLSGWLETGDRYVGYFCAVYPAANGAWSGSSSVVPAGWTIGTGADEHRICRYVADLDQSGKIDANIEHPAKYVDVRGDLPNQNFLIVGGAQTCPMRGTQTEQQQP